jgi:hypothetical protein
LFENCIVDASIFVAAPLVVVGVWWFFVAICSL